jgi:competence protein ComEA
VGASHYGISRPWFPAHVPRAPYTRFAKNFLAQKAACQLDIGKHDRLLSSLKQTNRRRMMKSTRTKVLCVLALCLGLALSSVSVLAQKSAAVPSEKINLNTATAEQLQSVPGIGPSTAKSILDYRAKVGKFNKIEEIINVKVSARRNFRRLKTV